MSPRRPEPWKLAASPWGWVLVLRFAGVYASGRWAPWTWRVRWMRVGPPPVARGRR